MEASKIQDIEFKTMVLRMLKECSEKFNSMKKDTETLKMDQSEVKDTLTKMKNNLQGINSRVDDTENQISDLEYKEAKNSQSEQQGGGRI